MIIIAGKTTVPVGAPMPSQAYRSQFTPPYKPPPSSKGIAASRYRLSIEKS
jgi:hypothetical protein